MNKNYLILVFTLAVLVAVVVAPQLRQQPEALKTTVAEDCDAASRACLIRVEEMSFLLEMVRPQGLKPFLIEFRSDVALDEVGLRFEMTAMEMNQPLRPMTALDGQRWQLESILPICSSGRSDWLATIQFERGGQTYRLQFPFIVY